MGAHQELHSIEAAARQLGMVGTSCAHRTVLETLYRVAQDKTEVLLTGPTGVGKDLYARFVHRTSPRQGREFQAINCGALPDHLFENEFFGHAAGAYTDAREHAEGLVAAAHGGTLFLDEVDSLSLVAQVKLLRLLESQEYRRLGETRIRHADLRIISATNVSLEAKVADRSFRADLFYRIRVALVRIPPLCERPEDIDALAKEFIARYSCGAHRPPLVLTDAAWTRLRTHPWPGNVRELENCIRSLASRRLERPIEPSDVLDHDSSIPVSRPSRTQFLPEDWDISSHTMKETIRMATRSAYILCVCDALERAGGNITLAAARAGKDRRVFARLMKKYGIKAGFHRRKEDHDKHGGDRDGRHE